MTVTVDTNDALQVLTLRSKLSPRQPRQFEEGSLIVSCPACADGEKLKHEFLCWECFDLIFPGEAFDALRARASELEEETFVKAVVNLGVEARARISALYAYHLEQLKASVE